jgi:hypothetical protein
MHSIESGIVCLHLDEEINVDPKLWNLPELKVDGEPGEEPHNLYHIK